MSRTLRPYAIAAALIIVAQQYQIARLGSDVSRLEREVGRFRALNADVLDTLRRSDEMVRELSGPATRP